MIFRAQNIPRKKAITVAARPVFKEIHRGLQFISFKNSVIVHSCTGVYGISRNYCRFSA